MISHAPIVSQPSQQMGVGGGGGTDYEIGHFPIQNLGLGTLVQSDTVGVYGSLTPEAYWEMGFIKDGLISHSFLRQFDSWTLDFNDMVYYFTG